MLFAVFWSSILSAAGTFVATPEGVRYVVKNASGQTIKVIKPDYNPVSGDYFVKQNNRIIANQSLPQEARGSQFKIVAPVLFAKSICPETKSA